jgi:uncharacterized protein (DUF58 family)
LHGEDFYALREYQVGDDLRRVHWASSARADRLMIREDHEPAASRLLLIGDLRSSRHNAESLERTLSVLASLADAGLRGSHSVRVTTTGGADSHWGEGSQHALSIMDLLAAANADAPKRTTSLLRCCWDHASAGATLVVVTTDGVAASDLAADVVAGGAAVVVIQRAADPGGSATQGSGSLPWPAVPVALGLPFSSAWADRPAALR